jgi:hypothetical protein
VIERPQALQYFEPVTDEGQEMIHAERIRIGLPLNETHPLTHRDYLLMNNFHRNVNQQ